jgi:hypothetical protein
MFLSVKERHTMKSAPQLPRQLSTNELDRVAGGDKATTKPSTRPLEYMKVTMQEVLVTSSL